MILILFRHGIAVEADEFAGQDFDRPLTNKGRKRTRAAAVGLRGLTGGADLIISSPRVRAQQTAEMVRQVLRPDTEIRTWNELSTGANRRLQSRLTRLANKQHGVVVLVGHEPHLGELASLLLTGSESTLKLVLKKAGAVALDYSAEGAVLLWHMRPTELGNLGNK